MEQTDEKKTADYWLNEFHADPLSMKIIQLRDGLAGNLLSRVRWAMEEFSKQEVTLATTAQQSIIDGQKERIWALEGAMHKIANTQYEEGGFGVYREISGTASEFRKIANNALNKTKP